MTSPRAVAACLVAVVLTATTACSNPGLDTSAVPTVAPERGLPVLTSAAAPPGSRLQLPTVTPITPAANATAPANVPSAPPPPDTATAHYSDPVGVARAWLAQWCWTDYRQPINSHIHRAATYQTEAGKAADLERGDNAARYRRAVEQRVSARCDRITAEISPQAPRTLDRAFVVLTAQRVQLADDVAFQTLPIAETRAVARQPDGRWLIDVRVEAG